MKTGSAVTLTVAALAALTQGVAGHCHQSTNHGIPCPRNDAKVAAGEFIEGVGDLVHDHHLSHWGEKIKERNQGPQPGVLYGRRLFAYHPKVHEAGKIIHGIGRAEEAVGAATTVAGVVTHNQNLANAGNAELTAGVGTDVAGNVIKHHSGVLTGRRLESYHPGLHKAGKVMHRVGRAEEAVGVATSVAGAVTHNQNLANAGNAELTAGVATDVTGNVIKHHSGVLTG
eukprot:CAMPEP_0197487296 /NCGR_PEP_ID=MMETSP1311-20131121/2327_1 /TAXON_ID=464262 /ORGANISM="Genus nov. species nov., Strain RCC856" /LENGTH=227 /DNA_ID=CAMNT_0043030893 /DNA_START=110 /DNA_END=793 /DNA_ORIENTATION=-